MKIQVIKATDDDFRFLENLVTYYIYDMSEYTGWDCNAEGRWGGGDDFPDYWQKSDHHPFMIKVDKHVAGFAMIRRFPEEPRRYDFGEFFVARKFKGRGIGRTSARLLFDLFPSEWIVRVLDRNTGARTFWDKIVREYTGGVFEQTSEQYVCPYSGTWPMQYYRFATKS